MNISENLDTWLVILTGTASVFLLLIGILAFVVVKKLLKLLISVDNLVNTVDTEFVPTIHEVQTTLKHISNISDKADKQISELSSSIEYAQKTTNTALDKAKVGVLSVIHGLTEGVKCLVGVNTSQSNLEKEINNV